MGQYILQQQVLQHLLCGGINQLIMSLFTRYSISTLSLFLFVPIGWQLLLAGSLTQKSFHTQLSVMIFIHRCNSVEYKLTVCQQHLRSSHYGHNVKSLDGLSLYSMRINNES